jgi:hypothetical protein
MRIGSDAQGHQSLGGRLGARQGDTFANRQQMEFLVTTFTPTAAAV